MLHSYPMGDNLKFVKFIIDRPRWKIDRNPPNKVVRTNLFHVTIILGSVGNWHSDGALGQQIFHAKLWPRNSF